MKNYNIIIALSLCSLLVSCASNQKITVMGTPGTEIFIPNSHNAYFDENNAMFSADNKGYYANMEHHVIPSSGSVSFDVSKDAYYPYLIAHNPINNEYVPFALDYKKKGTGGLKAQAVIGYATCFALIGFAIGMPATQQLDYIQGRYQFRYDTPHSINDDIAFKPIVDTGFRRTTLSSHNEKNVLPDADMKLAEVSSFAKSRSSKSNRSLSNNAAAVEGIYNGSGSLKQDGVIIEKYSTIEVSISRVDNNTVSVDVKESGESFFSTKSMYSIEKENDSYTLTLKGIPAAKINIEDTGSLQYTHPKVNIDGEIYTLEIYATK